MGAIGTIFIQPNGDGATLEWTPSAGVDHYALVDEDYNSPNTTDYISTATNGNVDILTFNTDTIEGNSMYIGFHMYGKISSGVAGSVYPRIWDGYGWRYFDYWGGAFTTSWGWYSVPIGWFATFDQTQIDNIQVRIEAAIPGGVTIYISCIYLTISYTGDPDISLRDQILASDINKLINKVNAESETRNYTTYTDLSNVVQYDRIMAADHDNIRARNDNIDAMHCYTEGDPWIETHSGGTALAQGARNVAVGDQILLSDWGSGGLKTDIDNLIDQCDCDSVLCSCESNQTFTCTCNTDCACVGECGCMADISLK